MKFRNAVISAVLPLLAATCFADFRYEETTRITGGAIVSMAKLAGALSRDARQLTQPVNSTVLVKGDRMAHINADTTQIIDLDKETITNIDHRKKQYTVTTFEQMKQQMLEAQRRAREQQGQRQPQSGEAPPQMNFKVAVRNTGASKSVAGLDAKEAILSMAMQATDQKSGQTGGLAITNDMWMAPEIPGYEEVRDFQRRLAVKMGMVFGDTMRSMTAMQPNSAEGMGAMVKEMSKLSGVPVQQIMRMGSTANGQPLPAASEAPLPESHGPSAGEVAEKSATSAIAGRLGGLGGLGGLGRKKKEEPPPEAQQGSGNGAQSVLMESIVEMTGFSSAPVDAARFNVPDGYAQVAPPQMR